MDDGRTSICFDFERYNVPYLADPSPEQRCLQRQMHAQPVPPARPREFGRILSELQPRRVQDGRFLNVYNYGRGWNPREITGKACRTLLRRKAAATSGTRPRARRVDGLLSRLAPWALLDREFFSRMQRLAFERGCRRAILGKPSIVLAGPKHRRPGVPDLGDKTGPAVELGRSIT